MTEPRIPYIELPELELLGPSAIAEGLPPIPLSIKPFGTLVAIGVYFGGWLTLRQARKVGLDDRAMMSFIFWVVGTGFVLGHVLDTAAYYPARVIADPLSLFRLWEGLSSFGGFTGAVVGALAWRWRYGVQTLPYADVVASSFPAAWVFGRAGCAVAHDHPGMKTDWAFAVAYPDGGRFDLGLYEMVLTIPLAVAFLVLRRRVRPWGFYLAIMCLAYAPARFALDFLRADAPLTAPAGVNLPAAAIDPRYVGLTPAQWGCFVLLTVGAVVLWRTLERAGTPEATLPPRTPWNPRR